MIEIWDHHPAHGLRFAQVGFSHDQVGRAMAHHLVDAGHRHLVCVDSGVAEDYRAHERGMAFAGAARRAGADVRVHVAHAVDAFDAGRQAVDDLLAPGAPPVTAIAFANDNIACRALLQARRRSVSVPGRLALLGCGDFPIDRQMDPPLSSVQLSRREIGEAAAGELQRALREGTPGNSRVLPWALMARQSTARQVAAAQS